MRKLLSWVLRILLLVSLTVSSIFAAQVTTSTNPFAYLERLNPTFVNIYHGKLEVYRFGRGTPIVLICGYATNVSSWNREFLLTLARDHELIVFNNRGVDGSYVNSPSYSAKDLANDTDQLIKQLHLNKPAVIGISMGGMIAQQLAVSYPNDIGKLILINTAIAGKTAIPPRHEVEQVILNTPEGKLQRFILGMQLLAPPAWRLHIAVALMKDRFQPANHNDLFGVSQVTLKRQQSLVLNWSENNVAGKQMSELKSETLILSGGDDAVIPPLNSDILLYTIPHAKLYRWMDGGHAMIYQYPIDIANAINRFLM